MNEKDSKLIALAGNPNVGKSTIFNALTGARQHTGNWTGKTVETARKPARFAGLAADVVDLPGTMTLQGGSDEENIARDTIAGGRADVVALVADACALERNLILLLQIRRLHKKVVLCLNLNDEAEKKGIIIDCEKLSGILGVPVVATDAHSKKSMRELAEALGRELRNADCKIHDSQCPMRKAECKTRDAQCRIPNAACAMPNAEFKDTPRCAGEDLSDYVQQAETIALSVTTYKNKAPFARDRKIDKILTSKIFGIPIMLFFIGVLLWITVAGANYPSKWIASLFARIETVLYRWCRPQPLLADIFIGGMFHTVAVVVSVMLPPMAIFFPLFALLEEFGYLPRMAFLLDRSFAKSGTSGKQALCMCMGIGCNAAGVVGCRIINGEKQRIAAAVTNSFMPCNGRFPLLITLSALFFAASALVSAATVLAAVALGVLLTLLANFILTRTILRETRPHFSLELPPYRRPRFFKTVWNTLYEKAWKVLLRAVAFSAPFSAVIVLGAYFKIDGRSLLDIAGGFLQPAGAPLGVDGFVLLAFILALPANEIFLPVLLMCYTSSGTLTELSMPALHSLLTARGWTVLTAVNAMILCLLHFPCATALITIRRETGLKWAIVSFFLPLAFGVVLCLATTALAGVFTA